MALPERMGEMEKVIRELIEDRNGWIKQKEQYVKNTAKLEENNLKQQQ